MEMIYFYTFFASELKMNFWNRNSDSPYKNNKTFRTYSKYVLCGSGSDSDNNTHPDPYQTLLNIHQKMFFFSIHYEIKSKRYGIFKYLSE